MKRRYSHLGPVAIPHGMPLSASTMKVLRAVNDRGICWRLIADRCGVSRYTIYRALCGGNVRAATRESIRSFAHKWKRATEARDVKSMRRWSPARRAAHERKRTEAA
jgi:hypothetical protein